MSETAQDKNSPQQVLQIAVADLRREIQRIDFFLNSYAPENPLRYNLATSEDLAELYNTIDGRLEDMVGCIEQGALNEAWSIYHELKSQLLPTLANDLMAALGGIYLREKGLEMPWLPSEQRDRTGQELSFSALAEALISSFKTFGGPATPVVIVAEDRPSYGDVRVIRLRFPACDIWNLPFAGYEYGYLLARHTTLKPFRNELRDVVRQQVDPKGHGLGSLPVDKACYSDDIVRLWEEYHSPKYTTDDERAALLKAYDYRIGDYQDQMEAYVCRLFAEVFATAFVGPAYVHAMLHLRLLPQHVNRSFPGMPSFAHRFVFAFETLKWMDREARDEKGRAANPFAREIGSGGLFDLWKNTLTATGAEDRYDAITASHAPWIKLMHKTLKDRYNADLKKVFQMWWAAQALEPFLLYQDLPRTTWPIKVEQKGGLTFSLTQWPPLLTVLNAAWSQRWQNPREQDMVLRNALWFLSEKNPPSAASDATKPIEPTSRS